MKQVAVFKRRIVTRKPLQECLFQMPEDSNFPFLIPIPEPQRLESFTIQAEDEEEQSMVDSDEEGKRV